MTGSRHQLSAAAHCHPMPRTYLKVPFKEKDAAKALGARWDATLASWYAPEHLDVTTFSTWVTGSLATSARVAMPSPSTDLVAAANPSTAVALPRTGVPLSYLLAGVASAVTAAYKAGVWTTVEVTAINARNGHLYLELSERDTRGSLVAKIGGTIWAGTANRILPEFERATGASLAPGIKLLVRARPVYKPQYGISVDIDAIDPDYTLGDLEARKREIRARLQAEGLYEAQKALPAPWDYNALLVVSPDDAAGLGDFKAEAQRLASFGVCRFVYASSRFQGERAAAEIGTALLGALNRWMAEHDSGPDAIVLIRGGGAVNDLAWLNDYALAKLVCNLPVPVFTGIGHERDSTVLDEVAHTAFDTPSKVIAGIEQLIVRRAGEAQQAYRSVLQSGQLDVQRTAASVEQLDAAVRAGLLRHVELARRTAADRFGKVKDVAVESVHDAKLLTRDGFEEVRRESIEALATARATAKAHTVFVHERAGGQALRARAGVEATHALVAQGARRVVSDARAHGEALMREVAGQGPSKTLGRGFAIVRSMDGNTLTRRGDAAPGQALSVEFSDGSIGARVSEDKP